MTNHEMQETKAYKTYLGYATRVTPPKKAQKFKKPTSPKLTIVLVSPEEPIRKSEMALTKKAQYEEVRKKSLRDFHMTHLSGPGIVTSVPKIKPSITNKGTSAKPGVLDVTEEESTESEAESLGWAEDDSNNDHDSSSEGNDQKSDSGDNNTQSDNEKGSDSEYETDENETGSKFDQEENEKDVEDDEEDRTTSLSKPRPTLLMKKIKPVKNQRLKIMLKVMRINEWIILPISSTMMWIVSALEKKVAELKKDDLLNIQVTALVNEHVDSRLGTTRDEFMGYLLASITARITKQVKIQLP
nr:hypothetical protein [Tanacetum cinerariifolium]